MIKKLISIALLSMISLNSYSESYLFKIKLNNNVVIKDENGNIIENIIPPILTYNYPESTVPSSNWLAFLQDKNNLLSYSNLDEWELMDSGVSLSNHSLNDANLPQETFGISSIYSLNIGHNNFTHIDFLQGITESRSDIIANSNDLTNVNGLSSLISVKTLYLYDNDLKDVNGLRLLTSVDNILMFDNPNLTDITALSNISTVTGFIALDNPTQYTNKPLESSVFCQGISLDNFDVRQSGSSLTLYIGEICDMENDWIDFFHKHNKIINVKSSSLWESTDDVVSFSGISLTDPDLPIEPFGISSIYALNINSTNFTHLDFLQGVTEARTDMYLYNNNLTDISGLNELTTAGNILLFGNPNLTDITALSNISTVTGFIALDNPTQYTNKPLESSAFCQGISLDNFDVRQSGSSPTLYIGEICDMENDWIDLFHKHNKIINVKSSSLWESTDDVVSFSGISLTDPDLPTEPFGISSIYALNINSTNFTHLDFLQGVTEARTDMYLYNNNLTDISGLKELTTVGNILLFGNPNLTDITALSNISTVTGFIAIDNHTQYINKPLESSAFCQGIINGNIIVKNVTTIINSSQICS